jgi:hypothetical protein
VVWPFATMVQVRRWSGDVKHPVLPAREKMRRLSQIRAARFDPIVGSDRYVERLVGVPIQISDKKRAAAVRTRVPPLERTGDAGAEPPLGLARQLLSRDDRPGDAQDNCDVPRDHGPGTVTGPD